MRACVFLSFILQLNKIPKNYTAVFMAEIAKLEAAKPNKTELVKMVKMVPDFEDLKVDAEQAVADKLTKLTDEVDAIEVREGVGCAWRERSKTRSSLSLPPFLSPFSLTASSPSSCPLLLHRKWPRPRRPCPSPTRRSSWPR